MFIYLFILTELVPFTTGTLLIAPVNHTPQLPPAMPEHDQQADLHDPNTDDHYQRQKTTLLDHFSRLLDQAYTGWNKKGFSLKTYNTILKDVNWGQVEDKKK